MEVSNCFNIHKKSFSEKDYETLLRYQNSKIFIYQYSNEPIIRPVTTTQEYYKSFEQKQIHNKTSKILSSVSNILSTQSIEESNDNNKSFINIRHNLKKNFIRNNIVEKEYEIASLQYKHSDFLQSKKLEKLLNDEEFKQLCIFIDSKSFDLNMRRSKNIARWVLSHEYLKYHSRGEEIRKMYLKVLCPNYIFNEREYYNQINNEYNMRGNDEVYERYTYNYNNVLGNNNNHNSDDIIDSNSNIYEDDYHENDLEINEDENEDYNNNNNQRDERDCD
jgi:hypothetical protein